MPKSHEPNKGKFVKFVQWVVFVLDENFAHALLSAPPDLCPDETGVNISGWLAGNARFRVLSGFLTT
jgi:hypothetical protein